MGTLCTTTSLNILMVGVVFDTNTTNLASKCISWSENWIKGALSKRYDTNELPFTVETSTSMLTSFTEQLAIGHLWKQMSRGSKESLTRGDQIIKDVREAVLRIADYKDDLLDATTGSIAVAERTDNYQIITTPNYSNTFDEDNALCWKVDKDKLEDIANGRL